MVLCAISLFCVGPTTLLNVGRDQMLWTMILGQGLLGLFIPIGLILALPSMVESVTSASPSQVGRINNLSAGIFNTANGLGEVVGPLFGAAMYERSGFRFTSDIVVMITFFYAFVFTFLLTNGVNSLRRTLQQAKEETKEEEMDRPGTIKGAEKKDEDDASQGSESLLSSYSKLNSHSGSSSSLYRRQREGQDAQSAATSQPRSSRR